MTIPVTSPRRCSSSRTRSQRRWIWSVSVGAVGRKTGDYFFFGLLLTGVVLIAYRIVLYRLGASQLCLTLEVRDKARGCQGSFSCDTSATFSSTIYCSHSCATWSRRDDRLRYELWLDRVPKCVMLFDLTMRYTVQPTMPQWRFITLRYNEKDLER